ncbi:hypothetical protein [Alkalibaculum bacchi]|uniref:hypothetical protein n=1 Tax=Alkalibaculum bacchi TaxID=645887 RepID=UPI0026F364F4|nr:hypothetical protein [Alkalibaculum bacchi]
MKNPKIEPILGGKMPRFSANSLDPLIEISFENPEKTNVNATANNDMTLTIFYTSPFNLIKQQHDYK